MALRNFYDEHKKIIIIVGLIIIAFIIYRYFWEEKSFTKDFSITNLENRIDQLEQSIGINPTFTHPNAPSIPIAPGTPNAPIIHGQTLHKVCLDQDTQRKIADDINKKLKEINACDCRETCANMLNNNNIIQPNINQAPNQNNLLGSRNVEQFYVSY
ncbi:hypothetical protein QJ856_gp1004 [Tupanvirus deep ocean]|uniref:Uncharacterized protein n=2 Tax=Tupanvirus TaxID=2094720 RepID=A0AC62A7Y8_9VIRU|nr:hypothetical protein QJ856_gp1004 [Tupanvirus deep ocean]QKU33753.1 hypothetical protein [Tupanvirus deep ocean]